MPTPRTTLTELEQEMLKFSPLVFEFRGVREQAIRDRFGMSSTSFALALVRLIRREDAIAFAPHETARLRRLCASRQLSRSVRV